MLVLSGLAGANVSVAEPGDIEERIADFWKRVDALGPADFLSAGDLGQWALNVIERDRYARMSVAEFRSSTAAMQSAMERAGPAASVPRPPAAGIEQRIADFWKRLDALQSGDYLSAKDLGQWALNVIDRDSRARITVADFRASTAGMQTGMERAGRAAAPGPGCSPASAAATAGVEGRIIWNDVGVGNHRVEILENSREFVELAQPEGRVLGKAVTDAAGKFRITGLPVNTLLAVWMPEQGPFQARGYGTNDYPHMFGTCGTGVVDLGDVAVSKVLGGVSFAAAADLAPGALTITWSAVSGASTYCVTLRGYTGDWDDSPDDEWEQELTSGTCVGGYWPFATSTVKTASYMTTVKRGSIYFLDVYAVSATGRQLAALRNHAFRVR